MVEAALTAHEPLLVNTVGHSLGALLFGLSLFFLYTGSRANRLSLAAAALALVWNVASLLVLAAREEHWPGLEFLIAADIIRTVTLTPTLDSLLVLAGIVVVRTFLSLSLQVEIDGRWPWQPAKEKE